MDTVSLIRKSVLMTACTLGITLGVHAQSISEIKESQVYVWGEGTATTTDAAEQAALAQMSRSISVFIFNKTAEMTTNGDAIQQRVLQSISSTRLQNVQTRVLSDEPNARVFCYMHRSEVQKMFKQRKERIVDLVETGKKAEERLQIDDALRCYYWALLLSKSSPKDTTVVFGEHSGFATSQLPVKIKSVIQQLRAEVVEGEKAGKNAKVLLKFTYNGKIVSSLQFNYNDGQGIVGPVIVKDGLGEVDLAAFPGDGKLHITYETRFKNEVDPMDGELRALYGGGSLPSFNATDDIPIKLKGDQIKAGRQENAETASAAVIAAEPTKEKKPIAMKPALNADMLYATVQKVEDAIRTNSPQLAFNCFTPEGYELFNKLMTETGQVSLVGKSNYEFINADGYLLGRSTRIKVKFKSGKSFMENLVYRFNPESKKIESVAFALTKVAENDIMNASASWPEVSRWAILNFMEDYQTAFALKRLDYISSIFSDNAIIITGSVLKTINQTDLIFDMNKVVQFDKRPQNVKYSRHTKAEYIQRLGNIFKSRDYVHLTFENNVTKLIDLPSVIGRGAAFGIEIKQRYSSSSYSDVGYLTLAFDTRGKNPIIRARLWQPDKTEMMSLDEFISKFTE